MRDAFQNAVSSFLDFKFVDSAIKEWTDIQNDRGSIVPVNYSFSVVEYQARYFKDVYQFYEDLSLVIYNGGRAVAIWPLCIMEKSEGLCIGSNGGMILPPLLANMGYNTESVRKLLEKCKNAICSFAREIKVSDLLFHIPIMEKGCPIWMMKLMESGGRVQTSKEHCWVDLSMEMDEILSAIRRTNKYSILKGKELWKTEIIDKENEKSVIAENFEKFEAKHIEVSGRRTRSHLTWELQKEAVMNGDGFLVMMYDSAESLIGCSMYRLTATVGSYAVAAYNRNLFDKPVAHVSQWTAIHYMKAKGLKWYYIGYRPYVNDVPMPTDKEIAIGHFKEGFATHMFPALEIAVKHEQKELE